MRALRVLIGCEFSGIVRAAFRKRGHYAWSCDLLPVEDGSLFHIKGDVLQNLKIYPHSSLPWDIGIFFPPCKHLAVSGARWFKNKQQEQEESITFVRALMSAPIARIAIENPVGILSTEIRKPDQIIQPWMFGHGETKATCLWLGGAS